VAAYGERVVACAASTPSRSETQWASDLVASFGALRTAEQRDAIAAWIVASHLRTEAGCLAGVVDGVVVAEARHLAAVSEVERRYRGFAASLGEAERESLSPALADLAGYRASLEARPATGLVVGDGGVRLAGWEARAAPLSAEVREWLEAREVFRKPIDFIAHIAALDREV
jgi:hypothetical protein